ncbi:MAG: hypothetical protein ABF991_06625 [Liquorilactobacillus hordei]|uniref:Small integral membrane protein n=2 Tax=Liquorilactobacillus hordei TaxID=468911 RepID=A0A0R1MFX1_9LACO|nr:hypothetical protein [Liquorilactobacillus hordei]AUJ30156.1 hypothetical protein BSQ49_08015 [Liquorilactobacillus hordei]KRL07037.1 hypothetical protein FC92_GL000270 [Liquorilactobacillus hordei DSM 19519]QYH52765.1 hypothetical protein G6O70_10135 [Liquorilactobacillus hordei DSM 19519]
MRLSLLGVLAGFLIPLLWILLGFGSMLIILLFTVIGGIFGGWLEVKGVTLKKLIVSFLNKLTD